MATTKKSGINFQLSKEHAAALKLIGGERRVRLSGTVVEGGFQIDYIACNAPFASCNSAFTSCNSSFSSCNAAFSSCNAAFTRKAGKTGKKSK